MKAAKMIMPWARKSCFGARAMAAVALLAFLAGGCGKKHEFEMPSRPVQVAKVEAKDVPLFIDSFGTLRSPHVVDVKAQVTGEVKEVLFSEGRTVARGDKLVLIDPRQYQSELEKAEADLQKANVDFKIKKEMLERNKKLVEQQLISSQEYDQYESDAAAAAAAVSVSKAALDSARLNLEYCTITSPLAGVAGRRQVDPGNIVTANNGPALVNIRKIDSLFVDFSVSERDLARVRAAMENGDLAVQLTVDGQEGDRVFPGTLELIENTVDDQTGTVFLRAVVPNDDMKLWPGQFAKVRLILEVQKGALVVPGSAVRLGKDGDYLFVIKEDGTAELRGVSVGQRAGDYVVLEKGVQADEMVVTVGQMGLAPGAKTRIVEQPAAAGTATGQAPAKEGTESTDSKPATP